MTGQWTIICYSILSMQLKTFLIGVRRINLLHGEKAKENDVFNKEKRNGI